MKKILCFIITGLLAFSGVYAAENTFSYDENTYTVTVKGNSTKAFSVAVKEGEEAVSLSNKPVYLGVFENVGDYIVSVPLTPDSKDMNGKVYSVLINGENAGTFTYVDVSERSEFVSTLAVTSASDLHSKINANSLLLGLGDGEVTKPVADILYTRLPFLNAADFSNKLKYASVLDSLNKKEGGAKLLTDNDNLFSADLTTDFAGFSDAGVAKMVSLLSELNYTEKTFDEQYNDKKIAVTCYDVEHWTELAEILSSGIVPGINQHDSQINKIAEIMMDKRNEFTSAAEVVRCFNEAKAALNTPVILPGTGGGGGGSSSGGGGGFSVAPSVSENISESFEVFKFEDLDHYLWAQDAVYALKEKGIISGVSEKAFAPGRSITRAEFAKLITGIFNLTSGNGSFNDVAENSWYKPYVSACAYAGIILGDGENFFPEENVTRQDAAVMIFRALKTAGNELEGTYYFGDDENIAEYAKTAVSALAANKIIKGVGDSLFAPQNYIDRASAAVLIYNTMNSYLK
ncbi:MAG: S-layer homology domain-containing protein [Clostridia bacterium]|nr:S-layer homology domain-containing protein [Clostridia bacterium]